jgi:hypothetical protein
VKLAFRHDLSLVARILVARLWITAAPRRHDHAVQGSLRHHRFR